MPEDIPDFYSWETPDLELTIKPEGSLTGYSDIIVSIHQGSQYAHLHADELAIEGDVIYVTLDQETTGKFVGNKPAHVQVNVLYDGGVREASTWGEVWVKPNLYRKVMT